MIRCRHETVRMTLKKTKLGKKNSGVSQSVSADFVWGMEDGCRNCTEPYQGRQPVVCFDERPCVLHGDTRPAVPAQPGRVARYDYEYQRNGHCNLFMLFQPGGIPK